MCIERKCGCLLDLSFGLFLLQHFSLLANVCQSHGWITFNIIKTSIIRHGKKILTTQTHTHILYSWYKQQWYVPCTFKVEGWWSLDKSESQDILVKFNRCGKRIADIGNMIQSQQRRLMLWWWKCIQHLVHFPILDFFSHLYSSYQYHLWRMYEKRKYVCMYVSFLSLQVKVLTMITDQILFIDRSYED